MTKLDLRVVGSRSWRDETALDQRPEPRYMRVAHVTFVEKPPRVPWLVVVAVTAMLATASGLSWWLLR